MAPPQLAPPEQFKSVTRAAIALAAGGQYVRDVKVGAMLLFEIAPPIDLDFDDPECKVSVPALDYHAENLRRKVSEFNRQRMGGASR